MEWVAASNTVSTLTTPGLRDPEGVAVDAAGNVYIAASGNGEILELLAATGNVIPVVSSGLYYPHDVAVDVAGNVYIADGGSSSIKKWTAVSNTVTTLVSAGLSEPLGVTVDAAGNVYVSDFYLNIIDELPHAFVDPTSKSETAAAGNDSLPAVLPATENLLAPFAPTSSQSWLTITGITNGVVSFSFTGNTGPARTAKITLLGQTISVTQGVSVAPGSAGALPALAGVQMLGKGVVQFAFTNAAQGASFTVLSTTNLALPLSEWTVAGTAANTAPGVFQFTSQPTTRDAQRFYILSSP
jgi:DNA-binding beta-propeller fold protein YncE